MSVRSNNNIANGTNSFLHAEKRAKNNYFTSSYHVTVYSEISPLKLKQFDFLKFLKVITMVSLCCFNV